MTVPSPALSVPTLLGDQIGAMSGAITSPLIMGYPPNTPYGITKLEGLDKPDVRSGNQDKPRSAGAFVGSNLLKTRTITATMDIGPPFGSYSNLAGAAAALRAACSTEGSTEYPVWIQLPNFPLVCCSARVIKKNLVYDVTADLGQLIQGASVQWEATDPYLYSAPTTTQTVGLAGPSTGFAFPITFNLSFGGSLSPNQMTVVNNGDVTCYPTLVIDGPCLNPSVQNTSVPGNPLIMLNAQFYSGDVVVIDCTPGIQSILYYANGSSVGVPYQQVLETGSTFFGIPANSSSTISFNSQDTSPASGTLTVWSASAYDGLL